MLALMRGYLDFVLPRALTDSTLDALHRIASASMEVERAWLTDKLRSFDRIILFRDRRGGQLVGCTGLKLIDCEHERRPIRLIYTGAVFIAGDWRGKGLIQRAGLQSSLRFGVTHRRLYWLSDCDSFRAYLLGVHYMKDCWPRRDAEIPSFEAGLLAKVCPPLFGDDWHPDTYVCDALAERRLKHAVAAIPRELRLRDPDADFFATRNPGYIQGDGLTMLARLDFRNLWHCVARSTRQGPRRRPVPALQAAARPASRQAHCEAQCRATSVDSGAVDGQYVEAATACLIDRKSVV